MIRYRIFRGRQSLVASFEDGDITFAGDAGLIGDMADWFRKPKIGMFDASTEDAAQDGIGVFKRGHETHFRICCVEAWRWDMKARTVNLTAAA